VVWAILSTAVGRTTIRAVDLEGAVTSRVAQRIARNSHRGQSTRFGELVIDHLARVAGAVTAEARAVAWLHDLLELVPHTEEQLRAQGLTDVQARALGLLTHDADESYEAYVLGIVDAPGRAGRIARMVKLADLDDHLAHGWVPPGAPPYAWARACVIDRVGGAVMAASA
jgi:hypothetical protein